MLLAMMIVESSPCVSCMSKINSSLPWGATSQGHQPAPRLQYKMYRRCARAQGPMGTHTEISPGSGEWERLIFTGCGRWRRFEDTCMEEKSPCHWRQLEEQVPRDKKTHHRVRSGGRIGVRGGRIRAPRPFQDLGSSS